MSGGRPSSFSFFSFLIFFLFMAAPLAYGSSQAKGKIRAAAGAYSTATVTPDPAYAACPNPGFLTH